MPKFRFQIVHIRYILYPPYHTPWDTPSIPYPLRYTLHTIPPEIHRPYHTPWDTPSIPYPLRYTVHTIPPEIHPPYHTPWDTPSIPYPLRYTLHTIPPEIHRPYHTPWDTPPIPYPLIYTPRRFTFQIYPPDHKPRYPPSIQYPYIHTILAVSGTQTSQLWPFANGSTVAQTALSHIIGIHCRWTTFVTNVCGVCWKPPAGTTGPYTPWLSSATNRLNHWRLLSKSNHFQDGALGALDSSTRDLSLSANSKHQYTAVEMKW